MGDTSNQERRDESSFVLQAMQQQFACMNMVFNKIRDPMDRQDVVIAAWRMERPQRVLNARRQERCAPWMILMTTTRMSSKMKSIIER
jgi:hypothetical protein